MDSSFKTGLGTNNPVRALALQPDGKLLVGGTFSEFHHTSVNALVRLNVNGTVDAGFANNIQAGNAVDALVLGQDGKVYAGGLLESYDGLGNLIGGDMQVFNTDGSIARANPGTLGEVKALALQADGKLILGGDFSQVNGVPRNRLARLNVDGSLDTTFYTAGLNLDAAVDALALPPTGQLAIGGDFVFASSGYTHFEWIQTGDTDSDGYADAVDAFPTNAAAAVDADHDGIPDSWLQPNRYGCTAFDASCNGLTITQDPPNVIYPLSGVYKGSSVREFSGWR